MENALKNPLNKEPFEEFALKSKKLLVIVNDATRPTPTQKILKFLCLQNLYLKTVEPN